jgi:hypothetical protein
LCQFVKMASPLLQKTIYLQKITMKQLLAIAAIISLIGCQKSGLEYLPITNPTTGGGNGGGTTPPFVWPAGTGEYAPYTTGSTFVFQREVGVPAVIDSFTLTVTGDTLIGGLTYKRMTSSNTTAMPSYFTNYNNGVVTEIFLNFSIPPVTIPTLNQTILKDTANVNTSWNEVLNLTVMGFSFPVTFTYTVMQKDIVKNVLAVDYANTTDVKQNVGIPATIATLAGIPANTVLQNFYAKGVGRIERDAVSNNTYIKLKRYNVVR